MSKQTKALSVSEEKLLHEFSRDLDVCTRQEMLVRWSGPAQQAIEKVLDRPLEMAIPEDHNPIWRIALRYWFDNDPSLLWAPLHRDLLCKVLLEHYLDPTQDYAGLLILIQRDSFKSTFTHNVFPLFIALREKHLNKRDVRIALIHHREQQASANGEKLRSVTVQHPAFKKNWPEFAASEDYGTKTSFDWKCRESTRFSEPSVLMTGLGARLVGLHFDWMLYSDPVTDDHIMSKLIREEALQKYQASRFMLDTLGGKEVIDGTRYHLHDLHSKNIKAKRNGRDAYRKLIVGAGGYDGVPLSFPNRHTLEVLEQKRQDEISRSGNDFLYWLQMQNVAKAGTMVVGDWNWLRTCKQNEVPQDSWRVILCDPAWKGTKNAGEGDDAAILVWALEKRGSLVLAYFLDGVVSNMLTGEDGKAEIFRFMRKYGVLDVAPEERGGYSFKTSLQNDANSRGLMLNVIDLKTSGLGKNTRISTFLGKCQRGEVFVCDSVPPSVLATFKSQYEDFPQVEHDDALDAAAYICDSAIEEAYAPTFNRNAKPFWVRKEPQEQRRTRHCAY